MHGLADQRIMLETVDYDPAVGKVKKTFPKGNDQWEQVEFYRVPNLSRSGPTELEKWCEKTYGPATTWGQWFRIDGWVFLRETAYTMWCLYK